MESEKYYISADRQLQDSFRLARLIFESGWHPEILIGLWRGGTPIAITIHEYFVFRGLNLLHMPVKCSSYTGMTQTHDLKVDFPENFFGEITSDRRVLLVDDVFDTGKTAAGMKGLIEEQGAEARIATLCWKPRNNITSCVPDYFIVKTDAWIVFPHELAGLSKEEIVRKDSALPSILGL